MDGDTKSVRRDGQTETETTNVLGFQACATSPPVEETSGDKDRLQSSHLLERSHTPSPFTPQFFLFSIDSFIRFVCQSY